MSAKKSLSKLRAALAPLGVAIAAAVAPGLAQADAVAQSYLFLNNFRFTTSQPLTILSAADSGDVSASLNGAPPSTATANPALYTGFTLNQSQGAGYMPGTAILGAPTSEHVGSYSRLSAGDPFLAGVQAQVDNTVSLVGSGTGSAQSNAQLGASFTLGVFNPGTVLGVSFDAEGFLRAMLNPFGANPANASAAYNWRIQLRNSAGAQIFSWAPDGVLGSGITGGIETADAFDLNDNIGLTFAGFNLTTGVRTGAFAAQTFALGAGTYFLDLRHDSSADATINVVPEPGALSLAGLALIAMGVATTRRRKVPTA